MMDAKTKWKLRDHLFKRFHVLECYMDEEVAAITRLVAEPEYRNGQVDAYTESIKIIESYDDGETCNDCIDIADDVRGCRIRALKPEAG